ncbi:sensor histidine kinase [Poseidonocella sedimentorum]|uniref:sensor histidine kinase n=1 Tax=Poseidonocella sedimentorum TaxID=871652 RepID=UPI001C43305B|nr:sensor histidine kinase [Poseidonocella sedimentorum]
MAAQENSRGAAENRLVLTGQTLSWREIAPHVRALRDPGRGLDLAGARAAPAFAPLEGESADFGYTRDVIWLRLGLVNGRETTEWRLAFRENFLQLFEVWLVQEGGAVTQLEALDDRAPFRARAVAYPELVAAFSLAPGAGGEVFVRYWSGGSSELSWSLMTEAAFADWAARKTAKNFIYYGMLLLLMTGALVAFVFTGQRVFGAYSLYALFGLLFIMHADGNTFRYLWPEGPRFNGFASVLLGAGMIISGANFARIFLQTRRYHPRVDVVLMGLVAGALGLVLSTVVVDAQPVKKLLVILSFAATLAFTGAGLVAARTRFREVRFYVIAWTGAVLSSGIMTMRHWFGIEISEELQFDSIRIVLVVDAALMGLAIVDRFNQLKQTRQEALERSLRQARKSIELSRRMEDLERQVSLAERLSQAQRRSMTETVHDLRQPLNALRLNIRNAAERTEDPAVAAEAERTVAYLEELVATELTRALEAGDEGAPETPTDRAAPAAELTPVGDVLVSVQDMFASDATEKGLRLSMVPSGLAAPVPPLALMRMLSNLVANAIRATEAGGVLIGVRHAGGARIEVHDTGPGLDPVRFAAARAGAAASAAPPGEGTGLGLAIVADLAARHGLRFTHSPRPGGGTCLQLWL